MPCTFSHERLHALWKRSGRTQTALAAEAGVDQSDLSKMLRGEHVPRADTLARLLGAMGCSWGDLDEPRPKRRKS